MFELVNFHALFTTAYSMLCIVSSVAVMGLFMGYSVQEIRRGRYIRGHIASVIGSVLFMFLLWVSTL